MANVKWQRLIYFSVLMIVLACVSTAPAISQDTPLEQTNLEQTDSFEGTDPGLIEDAQWYAQDQGIPLDEAVRRVKLMELGDDLAAELFENERETFGGIWVQHQPEFRIKARFTRDGEKTIQPYISDNPLNGLVDVLPASATFDELVTAEARARYSVDGLSIPAESGIDETNNSAYVNVTDLESLKAILGSENVSLPIEVKLNEVDKLARPGEDIYGGHRLQGPNTYCTNGLSVVHSSGATGVTTSGHCPDSLEFRDRPLDYQNNNRGNSSGFYGPYDLQWHTTPFVEKPRVRDGEGSRLIVDAKGRMEYMEDRIACHFGQGGTVAEYNCGYIRDRNYRPVADSYNNPAAKFVKVDRGGDIFDFGDSGGPWYVGGTALGITSGGVPDTGGYAFYMSLTYFNDDGQEDFNLVVRKG